MADTQRYPSSAELDLKARQESGEVPARRSVTGEPTTVYSPYATENTDTSAYVGVNPEYMTYANDTEKPLRADDGVEKALEEVVLDGSKVVVGGTAQTATDADTTTGGSGASSDLVYTGSSGEKFTAVKAPAPEVKVTEEEQSSEGAEVTVPVVKTEQPSESPVEPANTPDSPTDAPPTPVAEKSGAKTTTVKK